MDTYTAIVSYIAGISSVIIGAGIADNRSNQERRRTHRKFLRTVNNDQSIGFNKTKAIEEWWITAIEDYSLIRKIRINNRITLIQGLKFPTAEWDINLPGAGTTEQHNRYEKELAIANQRLSEAINHLIKTT